MSHKQLYQKGYPLCIILLVLMILNLTTAFGAVIRVPVDYQFIQTAIDAAADGDTVLIADGTYKGVGNTELSFKGKSITLRSENGPQNCIIDCEGDKNWGMRIYNNPFHTENVEVSGLTITNFNFTAIEIQAGLYNSPIINNCIIKNGPSSSYYGGITVRGGSPIISNCIIAGNRGSGIHLDGLSWPKIINCTIEGNTGSGIFGKLYDFGSDQPVIYIINCLITGNSGGGLSIRTEDFLFVDYFNVSIIDSKIIGNTGWGIVFVINASVGSTPQVSIVNSIVAQNTAESRGGGILMGGSGLAGGNNPTTYYLTNSTISGNSCMVSGGGIYSSTDNLIITNSILWGNFPLELSPYSPEYKITFSDIRGGHEGEGNIDADPKFVGNGDYHITAQSPCIDAGTSEGATDHDIDGDSRPQGAGYDMGADEYAGPEPCFADFSANPTRGPAPLTVNFTDQSTGSITSWEWDFGDGLTSTTQNPFHTYTDPGTYTVTLTVTGSGGSDSETKPDYIQVTSPGMAMPWIPLLLDN